MLNKMCLTCKRFTAGQCTGTDRQTWTGCALKERGTLEDQRKALRADLVKFYIIEETSRRRSDEWYERPESEECAKAFRAAYEVEKMQLEKVVSQLGAFLPYERRTIIKMIYTERAELLAALESCETLAALV